MASMADPGRCIFISYASPDAATAQAVCSTLELAGFPCWIAPRDVLPGTLYADGIVRAINECKLLVLILSKHSVASAHVGKEIERGSSKGHPILALRTDAAPLTPAFEYFLNESQWIVVGAEGMDAAIKQLASAVGRHLSTPPPIDSAPLREIPNAGTAGAIAPRRNWGLVAGVAALALAMASVGVDQLWLHRPGVVAGAPAMHSPEPAADKSVAVLPFVDMSETKDQEYFADGMAEEVLDLLAKVPGIRVIGRTSSFQFKGRSEDLRTIGRALGAAYVIEGTVRKSGDRLRVTAQLTGAGDGSHQWSQTYDESSGDVLGIQDRIAAGIVRALQVAVGADGLQQRPPLKSADAYDLYLRGRHEMDRFDKAGFETAAGYFQQALRIDPSLVRAAEWLGAAHEFLAEWGFVPVREGYELTRASLTQALKLDPRSGLAHSLMCTVNLIYDWDSTAAMKECEIALVLEPRNPQVLGYSGQVQAAVGHWDEAARLTSESIALDPLFSGWHDLLAIIRDRTGRLAEAEAERRRTLEISPTYERAHFDFGLTLAAEGKLDAALSEMAKETPDGGRDAGLAIIYGAMGRTAESDAALARFTQDHAHDRAYRIAQIHGYRGATDAVFVWLDRAYQQKDVDLWWIKGNLAFRHLENNPRYKAFLRRMKLPD